MQYGDGVAGNRLSLEATEVDLRDIRSIVFLYSALGFKCVSVIMNVKMYMINVSAVKAARMWGCFYS
jgi:hypothetical protein